MTSPRPKTNIRRLVILVAATPIVAWIAYCYINSGPLQRRAAGEANLEKFAMSEVTMTRLGPALGFQDPDASEEDAATAKARLADRLRRLEKKIEYHRQMKRKYEFAAALPFLPVWPDPPEPE